MPAFALLWLVSGACVFLWCLSMILLSLNCQGTPLNTVHSLRRAIQASHPSICFLIETRKTESEMDKLRWKLGFEFSFVVPCEDVGRKRGLALFSKVGWYVVMLSSSDSHVDVQISAFGRACQFTSFYGRSEPNLRYESWELLRSLARLYTFSGLSLVTLMRFSGLMRKIGVVSDEGVWCRLFAPPYWIHIWIILAIRVWNLSGRNLLLGVTMYKSDWIVFWRWHPSKLCFI